MSLRVLIADDDSGMRLVLKKALQKIEDVEVIGEAEDGEAALALFNEKHPDLVFMDVEMPRLSGIECAKRIADINPKQLIIFVTAHTEYMPEAFELYAFDYLVKPFKLDRIYKTIERIQNIETKESSSIKKIIKHEKGLEKLILKHKEGISFIDINQILLVQRENRSTVICTRGENYSTSESLGDIEEKLDKTQFFRSHKSYIINLSMIDKIYPYGRWTYIVKLKNSDMDALLTHDKYLELEKLFST